MSQIKLTRVELNEKREQLELASIGHDLLENRLGALLSSFMQYAQKVLRSRQDLVNLSRESAKSLALSSSLSRDKLIQAAYSTPSRNGIIIRYDNIMGTIVPTFELVSKNLESQSESPLPFSVVNDQLVNTMELFKRQLEILVDLATMEITIEKIGKEIKRVRHRYNALENLLIPELKRDIQKIILSLEEKEREENYKIRHFMKKNQ